jgi:hypothetical protein
MKVRFASLEDSALVLEWRNDPITIANFRTNRAIPSSEHIPWFAKQLKDVVNTFCFIGLEEGLPCGVVWFRRNRSDIFETSVNLAPSFRGKHLSIPLLSGAINKINSVQCIGFSTEIRTTNIPSIKMFEACRYRLIFTTSSFGTYYRPYYETYR